MAGEGTSRAGKDRERRRSLPSNESVVLFQRLVEDTPMLATIVDVAGLIIFANHALCRLVGLTRPEVEGRSWEDVFGTFPEDDVFWEACLENRVVERYDGRILDGAGHEHVISWSNAPIFDGEGQRLSHVASLGEDVTARRQTETAVERSTQERVHLLGELINAEEGERARLAEALHDDTIQAMTAAVIQLGQIPGDDAREAVGRVQQTLAQAIDRARALMFELRPASLADLGLEVAIRSLCARAGEGSTARTTVAVEVGRYMPVVEELAFRTIREALHNAHRHSAATDITVHLSEIDGRLNGVVADNGHGFDPHASPGRSGLHIGIPSMRERLAIVGGSLNVTTAPGAGTRVEFQVPAQLGEAGAAFGHAPLDRVAIQPLWVAQWNVFRRLPDAFTLTRVSDGTIVDVSETYCDLTGYQRSELIGRTGLELDIWVGGEAEREAVIQTISRKGSIASLPTSIRVKQGDIKSLTVSATIVRDGQLGDLLLASYREHPSSEH